MQLGFIGLGKMGSRMVKKLVGDGHEVFVWNRSQEKITELKKEIGVVQIAESIENFVSLLKSPRIVWSMLPAGEPTDTVMTQLLTILEKGDIVIDGGNAHYPSTQKWYEEFDKKGIQFLGIGVSGGVIAATQGYPLMVGGHKNAYEYIVPLLDSLAKPHGGHEYFGIGGAGHFVKMVHNGIEYGYMQALGEGFGIMDQSPYSLDLNKIARLYQKGTLVSGFMLDRTVEALADDPKMQNIKGFIEESGEARWTVEEAHKNNVPVDVIETSLEFRRKSQKDLEVQNSFAAKLVAALRRAFGGHAVKH